MRTHQEKNIKKTKTTPPNFVCKPLAAANLDQSSWKQAPKHLENAIFWKWTRRTHEKKIRKREKRQKIKEI